ncbi:FGGY-family carbohydrate kinase [Micromonospora sp. WMMD882]|uniref:FGGY-family carbohydrate kinase n=1 Tax=Micromonospora sp. WMMD882 TaxID=3015151 RepID=UPI00248B4612|nr:FGGY-family carbohydrate kinase [Micromonospora sp. WMMD882]WBB81669.1 FGGY-family carbohydrate kinase [Micromonospora sp. WMMD882]
MAAEPSPGGRGTGPGGAGGDGPCLLGVDVGTSSTKGVLTDPVGRIHATATRPHRVSRPRPGWVEHDPETTWWDEFVAVVRELLAVAPGPVAGVAVSGIGPCLLPATAAGRPLRAAILYGVDTRATAEITELTDRLGADRIVARSGNRLTSQAVGPKLLWVRRHEPQVWADTRRFFMASNLLVHRLTGEYVLDHHSASQCDPLYDLREQRWIPELAEEVAPGLELPRLLWPTETAGRVTPAAAEATGLPVGTPVTAGTIDAWAESVSVGATRPGDLMLMYGTTMFLSRVVERPTPHPALWSTVGVLPGSFCLAGGMATSGAVVEWLRELTGGTPYERLTAEAEPLPPGADGLVVLPYFAGERTPLFDDRARGAVVGLTLGHGRGHLYRAVLEGTAYAVRHHLDTMAEQLPPPERMIAVGGGARALWTRIVSDVTGRPQLVPRHTIGASYGDAFLAGLAAGLTRIGQDWTEFVDEVRPQPSTAAAYDRSYQVFRELYPATRALVRRLGQPAG